jgi:hypothetical protein
MDILIFLVRLLFSALLYVFLARCSSSCGAISNATRHPSDQWSAAAGRRVLRGYNSLADGALLPLTPFTTIGRSDNNSIMITDLCVWRARPLDLAQWTMVAGRSR